jgi:mRNA-degrading endonuclease RelE of RelBE toxin-antitoxin system
LEVRIEREAQADLGALTPTLLREAYAEIVSLKSWPLKGQRLQGHPETGDLTGCRKLYFNEGRHRVIYEVLPDEQNPQIVRIIAVGRRANMQVYRVAVTRLGRTIGVDAPER